MAGNMIFGFAGGRVVMSKRLVLTVGVMLSITSAQAGTISGFVKKGGQPLAGALVTVATPDGATSETAYSNEQGSYQLVTTLQGAVTLRARAPMTADEKLSFDIGRDAKVERSFSLRVLTDPQEISDSLPASAHFARIKFPSEVKREQFQTDCLSCHQIGNPFTRQKRTHAMWTDIVKRMLVNANYDKATDLRLAEYVGALEKAFDGSPTKFDEKLGASKEMLSAQVIEWKLREAQLAHDTIFNPNDGKFYTSDEAIDQLYVTDPKTNKVEIIPIPAAGVREGGRFAELSLPPPAYAPTVRHGIHSLQIGPDGKLYLTGAVGGEIGVFDTKNRTYKSYPIGGKSLYPHTLRFDSAGMVWFTILVTDQIGRFDPTTGKITVIELPHDMPQAAERTMTATYGIDINPRDGSIWYSKLWANKIGRIDAQTLTVKEFTPPVKGPRRLRFDASGNLWIPGFGDSQIAKLDTQTMTYKFYKIPTLAEGEFEAPYALAVEPKTQFVWITPNLSDRLFRFDPAKEIWVTFPLPTRGEYLRDLVFPGDGRVCGSNNPMPPLPQVVEGGSDTLICLQLKAH
jgi:streptogramin lyase